MSDHNFCRKMLTLTMQDVRKHYSPEQIKKASVHVSRGLGPNPNGEFYGPNQEYIHIGSCCCAWDARAKGWSRQMKQDGHNG
jgi:hypothetical protein